MQIAGRHREAIRLVSTDLHAKELAAGDIRHERATLEGRLREDYGIELAELSHQPTPEEQQQREQVETEIAELRRKLSNIGGVNLDSLQEADELEVRFQTLSAQHQDLSQAKGSLEQIIHRINADSRRLFSETLETVREHFQQLFRKLFGGGQADIVLEEGEDILECGIEIVARPPGKEPRSISLLSGGEKTLTCVALLVGDLPQPPQPLLRARRSRRRAGRSQHRALHQRAQRIPSVDAVHRRHPLQKNDGLRHLALRRDHAGIRRLQASFRPLRRRQRKRRNQPRSPPTLRPRSASRRAARLDRRRRSGIIGRLFIEPPESHYLFPSNVLDSRDLILSALPIGLLPGPMALCERNARFLHYGPGSFC